MTKVGIYVFTHQIKQRATKKREGFFDGQNYIGLRYIVSEIPKDKYEITYVSKDTINSVDYCLISLTSYYDVINIINELYGKRITAKVCVGGAGYNNVGLLRDIVDIGTVGRGEGTILPILEGEYIPGIYYKEINYDLKTPIEILPLKRSFVLTISMSENTRNNRSDARGSVISASTAGNTNGQRKTMDIIADY